MRTVLLFLLFTIISGLVIAQTVPNTVVFKVRKKNIAQKDVVILEDSGRPFLAVEEPATFRGGDLNKFSLWVSANISYPQIAVENSISGKVYIQFVVNEKGFVENVEVLRSAHLALDAEAVRIVSKSPQWAPPRQGGKRVRQLFTFPVTFTLNDK
jgi:protein TonB